MSARPPTTAQVFLRPIANPMALGFLGLAVATLVDSGISLKWYALSEYHQAALVLLIFAPLTQVIACVFGYLSRDPIASTGMGVQAAGWLCIGVLLRTGQPGATQAVLGTLLFAAGGAMLIVSVVALGSKVVPGLVMATTGVRWIVDGVYQSGGAQAWQHVGGIIGVVLFAAALYTALALALEDQRKRTVLPTLRRGTAADVLKPDLSLQTEQVAAEAGVRSEL